MALQVGLPKPHGRRAADSAARSVPRHRAEPLDDPANTGQLAKVPVIGPNRAHGRREKGKASQLAVTTGSMLIVAAAVGMTPKPEAPASEQVSVIKAVPPEGVVPVVAGMVPFGYAKPMVTTQPAPAPATVVEAPKPVITVEEVAPAAPATPAPVIDNVRSKPAPVAPAPAPPPPPPVISKGQHIASAALAQVGVMQDCTMLATHALAAVGINFHGWPWEYPAATGAYSIPMAQAMPGDLLIYTNGGSGLAHIAIYIGNGQAVHGGWNGNETRVFSANVGSGPAAYRVT